jgi:hypothetical protein
LENEHTVSMPVGRGGDGIVNNLGDFDGDGRADRVAWNLDDNNVITWYILQSETNSVRVVEWGRFRGIPGVTSDDFVPADYDGDGKTDIAVYRRATAVWYIIESSTGNPRYEYWGRPGNLGVVSDFDGDGKADLCVLRLDSGTSAVSWYVRRSSDGQMQVFQWGNPATDRPFLFFPIDVDNDGKDDAMMQRVVNGQFVYWVRRSSDAQAFVLTWGSADGTPSGTFFPLFGD